MIYRLFMSQDADWFVLAKKESGSRKVTVLYRGHSRSEAYRAWLNDLDAEPNAFERDMSSGDYDPTWHDFL